MSQFLLVFTFTPSFNSTFPPFDISNYIYMCSRVCVACTIHVTFFDLTVLMILHEEHNPEVLHYVIIFISFAVLQVFKAMKIQVQVFWVLTLCSKVVGYQRFGGSCCQHLQLDTNNSVISTAIFSLKTCSTRSSEALVLYHNTTRRHNPEEL
jgi:hypothetical protein